MRITSTMSPLPRFKYTGNAAQLNQTNFQTQSLNTNSNFTVKNDTVSFRPRLAHITFTGGGRNMNQIASIAYENMGTGLPEDYQGGLGVVTFEAPQSMRKHEGLDVRSFSPFFEHDNPKGGYKFLYTGKIERVDGKLPEQIEAKWFMSAEPGQSIEDFAKVHNFDVKDLRYVIQSEPNGKEANSLSKYALLEPTGVKGSFERMDDEKLGELKTINYEIFEYAKDNPSYNKLKDTPNYRIFTNELAKTTKPYSYGSGGNGGFDAEIINADCVRAYLDAEKKMNTERFGNWKPASYWGHDRPIATILSLIADASAKGDDYYNGTITHHTLHNPGRNYQGATDNPFLFARMIFDKDDVIALRNHPQYELLQNFNARGWDNLTEVEKNFVRGVFDPMIGQFKDFFNTYNVTKIAIVAKKVNPLNSSIGTVSPNFDKEMKNPDMDVAAGLGGDFREIETTSPLNGSTPASLGLDNNTQDFGRGGNILSEKKSGFTPLVYDGDIEAYIKKREYNSKWLTDILAEAQKQGPDAVNHVFYNDIQIEQGRSVIGNILDFTPGKDLLIVGWGRPDEQKGFPITLQGFLDFLKRDDVPQELKKRVNMQIGWGDLPFDKKSREWHSIYKLYNEIITLDGGIYKNNLMLADGRYPNKLVGCATHGIFTSRREMCGITPLEAKAAGVGSCVTATGGPVDYINEKNGWKTKTAPEMNPPFDGLDWNSPADVIDDKRIARSASEVSDCIKNMAEEYANNRPSYIARCKKNIEEKFDWHNNDEFNGGKCANKMYKEDIWKINQGWEARNKNPLKRLIGKMQKSVTQLKQNADESITELLKKAEETINRLIKQSQESIKQSTDEALTQIKELLQALTKSTNEEIKNSLKESLEKALETLENAKQTSLEEIKTSIEKTVKNTVENAKPQQVAANAKNSKIGKIAAFTGGLSAAALGFGGWYFYKGSKLIKQANKTLQRITDDTLKNASQEIVQTVQQNNFIPVEPDENKNSNLLDRLKQVKSA